MSSRTLSLLLLILFSFPIALGATTLPGFIIQPVAPLPGFPTSIVTDSHGTIYFTTTAGEVGRIENGQPVHVATLPTHEGGNGGLLGMALIDDSSAVVHYTTWDDGVGDYARVLADVIARLDLTTGQSTVLHSFDGDVDVPSRGVSSEHHGGNPIVAPDGAVFVGIGEYNGHIIAQMPGWNGGRIFRIDPLGNASEWALGLRNPYDLAWDSVLNAVVASDNGPDSGDEINVIPEGSNCGWPRTWGDEPPVVWGLPPVYVFPEIVAPTGLARLGGPNPMLPSGYLSGSFETSAIYWFPDLTTRPVPDPYALVEGFGDFLDYIIDVTQAPNGDIYFVSGSFVRQSVVWRLQTPERGDCNGDGLVDWHDLGALRAELGDGEGHPARSAQDGDYRGSWGCDATGDGSIGSDDYTLLTRMLMRPRAVRRR